MLKVIVITDDESVPSPDLTRISFRFIKCQYTNTLHHFETMINLTLPNACSKNNVFIRCYYVIGPYLCH